MHDGWWWTGQVVSLIGFLFALAGMWSVNRGRVVGMARTAAIFATAGWGLQGGWGAAAVNALNIVRGFTTEPLRGRSPFVRHSATGAIIAITVVVYLGLNGWPDQWWEWLPLIGQPALLIGLALDSVLALKLTVLFAQLMWLAYKVFAENWGSVPGEVVGIVFSVIAVSRLRRPAAVA